MLLMTMTITMMMKMNKLLLHIDRLGAYAIHVGQELFNLVFLLIVSIRMSFKKEQTGNTDFSRSILQQVYFTAFKALPAVFLLASIVGSISVVYMIGGLGAISGMENIGKLTAQMVVREISPVTCAFLMIVRSSTAVTAQFGIMRIQREIEAMEIMGISPVRYLVLPRIIGGLISFFCINIVFVFTAIAGGFLIANLMLTLPFSLFYSSFFSALTLIDIAAVFLKIFIGGVSIFLLACYYGMGVKKASTEIPVAVSKAASRNLLFTAVIYFIISAANIYFNGLVTGVN